MDAEFANDVCNAQIMFADDFLVINLIPLNHQVTFQLL